jgi:hypothetical protein
MSVKKKVFEGIEEKQKIISNAARCCCCCCCCCAKRRYFVVFLVWLLHSFGVKKKKKKKEPLRFERELPLFGIGSPSILLPLHGCRRPAGPLSSSSSTTTTFLLLLFLGVVSRRGNEEMMIGNNCILKMFFSVGAMMGLVDYISCLTVADEKYLLNLKQQQQKNRIYKNIKITEISFFHLVDLEISISD